MRPSVNGDGVGRRWGLGVAAITTLIAMAFGPVASGYAERRALDAARRAAQTAKGAATQAQGFGGAALEAARSSAASLQGQATQEVDRPSSADCLTVQQEPMGVGWCKPSELAERAQQDADNASEGVSAAVQEHEQRLPNGVEVSCEGEDPSGTAPQAHATPPAVEDDGSSVNVSVARPSVTPATFDRGDRHCDPQTK